MARTFPARAVAAVAEHHPPVGLRLRPRRRGGLRRALARVRRLAHEPEQVLTALGVESHPLVCAACGEPIAQAADVVFSERFDGLVDPDCPAIPAWVRLENHAVRLLWLRTPGTDYDRVRPAPFSLEAAVRGL